MEIDAHNLPLAWSRENGARIQGMPWAFPRTRFHADAALACLFSRAAMETNRRPWPDVNAADSPSSWTWPARTGKFFTWKSSWFGTHSRSTDQYRYFAHRNASVTSGAGTDPEERFEIQRKERLSKSLSARVRCCESRTDPARPRELEARRFARRVRAVCLVQIPPSSISSFSPATTARPISDSKALLALYFETLFRGICTRSRR